MLSGKLPTGTIGASTRTERRAPGRDAATRGEPRGGATGAGGGRDDDGGHTGATRTPGASAAALERQLAAERAARRETVARYERLLDRRAQGDDDGRARGRTSAGVGHGGAWLRRAWCRLRLRLSRRG
jgi:hypothetical protein